MFYLYDNKCIGLVKVSSLLFRYHLHIWLFMIRYITFLLANKIEVCGKIYEHLIMNYE